MVEFIAEWLADSEISPLILTRGYAGGDEARMLTRHLLGTPAKIGMGANRAATAACFLKQYGYIDPKHWSLHRDLEIVMVNGLSPWGNHQLIPLGPLREPLTALRRADVAVVHHANLVPEQSLKDIELMMQEVKESLSIFFTRMSPLHFFEVGNINFRIPLDVIQDAIVLCVSAIGSANAFVQGIEKMGAFYVDRIDFTDHHSFQTKDIEMIMMKLRDLEGKFGFKPVVVVTEKDYDRDPEILNHLSPFKVMALRSELQIIPRRQHTKDDFRELLKELLEVKWSGAKH
ncbi:hypothetical protein GH714_024075 [Hevea brasiliensis]|uniref:tetraacyldisaccharide 4'-kinase n=1 Tax=Hevea brasiliensis TaxID=3981 RepID=A0A6A6MMG7_HEVBR|nr:hypothetical protein GH714_024075 [Hevea brasiliensis]